MIHCADNLEVLRSLDSDSVDLIATDPPYNTGRDFGAYADKRGSGYIDWLGERLVECRRLLKSTGSIYVQCDPHESHYIKVRMDEIFGRANFRNEIVWCYSNCGRSKSTFAAKHDTIFFYSKSDAFRFEYKSPVRPSYLDSHYRQVDGRGRRCRIRVDAGKTRTYYPASGVTCSDWWTDIASLNSQAAERVGYPTQKPVAIYERIIQASSPAGGFVLDPWMGSGTTLVAAKRLGRRFVGIDSNPEAVKIAERRLAAELV